MGQEFFTFVSAGEVVFGEGSLSLLKSRCEALGVKKPVVVTTGLKSTDIIPRTVKALGDCMVYDKVSPEPKSSQAIECVRMAKEEGCDGFIGIGGGSSMDLAKVMAVLYSHGGRPRDYIGEGKVPGPVAPVIAVPTTAGSGSEVTSVASLGHDDEAEFLKAGLSDNHLRPRVAVVDPLLLQGAPATVMGACGLDALAHCIEAYVAVNYRDVVRPEQAIFNGGNPIASTLAERAMVLIIDNLRTAVFQPQNRQARYNMALASTLAGLAFGSAGLGAVHASYYAVAEKAGTGHAFTVGTMLPHVMKFNVVGNPAAYARMAELFGVAAGECGLFDKAFAACDAVAGLVHDVGLPSSLKDLSITPEDVPVLAKKAMSHDRLTRGNPRKMDEEEFKRLYAAAL